MMLSEDEIRRELLALVNENTVYNAFDHDSLDDAIDFYVNELHQSINDFYRIEQDDIDCQNEDYSESYLYGVEDGGLVWAGDTEVLHGLESVSSHVRDARDALNNYRDNIRDIARYAMFSLIEKYLDENN